VECIYVEMPCVQRSRGHMDMDIDERGLLLELQIKDYAKTMWCDGGDGT